MHGLLGSCQLSPSATLRPSASTTHSEKEEVRTWEHCPSSYILLSGAHPEGPQQGSATPLHGTLMLLTSLTSVQMTY